MPSLAQMPTTTRSDILPSWHEVQFLHNEAWRWVVLLGVLIATFVIGKIVSFLLARQGRWLQQRERFGWLGRILYCISSPAALIIFAAGLGVGGTFMKLDVPGWPDRWPKLRTFWNQLTYTLVALSIGWAVYRLVDLFEAFLQRWTAKTKTQLDDQLVPLLRKALRVFLVILIGLFIAQNIYQWDVGAMLAGLGLGGLAFALAAQDALKNLFGSITIFADRPFQMGDWVRIADHEGVVEEVGFRSTRIRTFFGHLVTIPNATVADSPVDNLSHRPYIRRNLNVTVTYDTPPERLQRGIDILQEMLAARREHFPDDRPGKVYFSDFNSASLNIRVIYWFTPPDYWDCQTFNHDFNMELLRRFNAEGIEFAFPTQTLYLKQDSPLSADVRLADPGPEAPSR